MIRVEKLSYAFPTKDLYRDISFHLEVGSHCALIGSNGCGKSTLVDMLMNSDKYLFDGKIIKERACRIGYASQFNARDMEQDMRVFEFLSQSFIKNQEDIAAVCEEMARAEDMDAAFTKYQALLDLNRAMDSDNYESNIRKALYTAGMTDLENIKISMLSGGEYKLLQIVREMLLAPNLLILDEPDVFLDFANLNRLCQLLNNYKGTLLAVTHNRYLLNHCFRKILHLENGDLQEFDGTYTEYRCSILREKLALKLQSAEEEQEIARKQEMVEALRKRATDMVNPVIGAAVNAKQTQLDRLKARKIKAPFIEVRQPQIVLPEVEESVCMKEGQEGCACGMEADTPILSVINYNVAYEKELLVDVNFALSAGEKVAIVGANGTGKTTLTRDIFENRHPAIHIDERVKYACLSQLQGETPDARQTVYALLLDYDFNTRDDARAYLHKYGLEGDLLDEPVGHLSGGEQSLLQIALLARTDAQLLLLDEPTSHLDLYAQIALEKALHEYKGTVLMVSHDFYLIAGCADYVLMLEDNTMRRMRTRKFRKMVYDKYFDVKYLEIDRRKQELEEEITRAFKRDDLVAVDKLIGQLEKQCAATGERIRKD